MRWNFTSQFVVDVQFEDIDGGGVVHHPNYLRYLERARCQAMREIGVPFEQCLKDGVAFVVAELNSKYLRPLQFGQRVFVLTRLVALRKSSLKVFQKIVVEPPSQELLAADLDFFSNSGRPCFFAQLRLVAVNLQDARPINLPEHLRNAAGCPSAEALTLRPELSDVRLLPFTQDNG
jgi:YbgC/YbaW family acyl-CoA thioester hydrolase